MSGPPDPHADYLSACPDPARQRLLAIRAAWEVQVPGATRCIAYQMPALRLPAKGAKAGRIVGYFAAFKHHVGVYPPVAGPPELLARLAPYAGPKGNLIFPHAQDLPLALIEQVGAALARQAGAER